MLIFNSSQVSCNYQAEIIRDSFCFCSVPTAKEDGVVTQYFLRDPDGYYVEICNCDILTKFILSKDESQNVSYNETSVAIGMAGDCSHASHP